MADVMTATNAERVTMAAGDPPRALDPAMLSLGTLVPVLGAHPQLGASGVALALGDAAAAAGLRVRLIDCADPARSGLAEVCQMEGRSVPGGEGRAAIRLATRSLPRGVVSVLRVVGTGAPMSPAMVPSLRAWMAADPEPVDVTVIDVGWDIWQLMVPSRGIGPLSWCTVMPSATFPVFVVRASVPSTALAEGVLHRYEAGVQRLSLAAMRGLAVVGAESWPVEARATMGYLLRQAAGNAQFIPIDAEAAITGWTIAPAPQASRRAAAALLHRMGGRVGQAVGPPAPVRRGRRFGRF